MIYAVKRKRDELEEEEEKRINDGFERAKKKRKSKYIILIF